MVRYFEQIGIYQSAILCDLIDFQNIDFIPAHHEIVQEAEA